MNDLEKALNTIREECKKHQKCNTCPLRDCYDCDCHVMNTRPSKWSLRSDHINDVTPRVFE